VTKRPTAVELLILSILIWCVPVFAWLNAATGDCIQPDCPTEATRVMPVIVGALIALILQIAAAVWYARAHYGE
jgi:hypothetical protein